MFSVGLSENWLYGSITKESKTSQPTWHQKLNTDVLNVDHNKLNTRSVYVSGLKFKNSGASFY